MEMLVYKRQQKCIDDYRVNLRKCDNYWGNLPVDSNLKGPFQQRMEDMGGIKPVVIGGMGEVNNYLRALLKEAAETAAEAAVAKGLVKSLEAGLAQFNRKITNCFGMAITKAKSYRKLKGLSLCGVSREEAGDNWDRARVTGTFRESSTPDWLDQPANFMFLDFECRGFEVDWNKIQPQFRGSTGGSTGEGSGDFESGRDLAVSNNDYPMVVAPQPDCFGGREGQAMSGSEIAELVIPAAGTGVGDMDIPPRGDNF